MTELIDNPDVCSLQIDQQAKKQFQAEIAHGLSQENKKIATKYLYDKQGCELFDKITRHPDYYLTRCELDILHRYSQLLCKLVHHEPLNVVELGPGEGIKTQIILEELIQNQFPVHYFPIDISDEYLKKIHHHFKKHLPQLACSGIHADYVHGLEWIKNNSSRRNLVLFLGSSIGNFTLEETYKFLIHLQTCLRKDDFVLIGFDLCKNINTLMRAYNDDAGITKEFNLNLLQRINKELNADFMLDKFQHYATYNVLNSAMESYLVSMEPQVVHLKEMQKIIRFKQNEAIHVEYSFKYHLSQITELAEATGFRLLTNFMDHQFYFTDSLWQVIKS